jgi:uncharacterized repeat protein (TIGR01451 family)
MGTEKMHRKIVGLALLLATGLAFTAALKAQNAEQSDGVIKTGFGQDPLDWAADRKLRSKKPLFRGLYRQQEASHKHHQHANRPRLQPSAEPAQEARSVVGVPRRVRPKSALTGEDAVDSEIRTGDSQSSRRVQTLVEQSELPPAVQDSVTTVAEPAQIFEEAVEEVGEELVPANAEPELTTEDPNAIADEPAAVADAPAPVADDPAPVAGAPAPMVDAPATIDEEPATAPETPADQIAPAPISGDSLSKPIDTRQDTWATDGGRQDAISESNDRPAAIESRPQSIPGESEDLLFARKSALLSVETLGPRKTIIGKETTFQVRLQNLGEVPADGVKVRINTPEWAEIASAAPSRGTTERIVETNARPLTWSVDRLEARHTEVLELRIVPRRSDAFDLAVTWTFQPASSQTMIQVQEPQLEMSISGPVEVRYGDTKVYKLTVANPGTGDAENVRIQLMPVDGGTQPMAVQDVGTVAAGESKTLEVELTARQAGYININAIATADLNLRSEASEKVLVRRAGLTVDVVGPPAKYTGTLATFKFRVANPGTATAENIKIAATLPPGAEYVESSNGGKLGDGKVSWSIDALPAQREMVFSIKAKLVTPGSNVVNVQAAADRDLANSGTATTLVETLADLKLEISDPRGPIPVGEEMLYEIRLWNRGSKAAQDVEIVTFFSEGVEPVSAQGGSHRIGPGQVVFDRIPAIGVGEEVKLKIIAKASRGGNHIFRGEVECRDAGTRLAAEETTHFYDKQVLTAGRSDQARTVSPRR